MIRELFIPEGYAGLRRSQLTGLSEVVLLAGPNGSGKSRVLDAVRHNAGLMGLTQTPGHRKAELATKEATLRSLEKALEAPEHRLTGPGSEMHLKAQRQQVRDEVDNLRRQVEAEPFIHPPEMLRIVDVHLGRGVQFVDGRGVTLTALDQASALVGAAQFDVASAVNNGPSAVYALLTNWSASANFAGGATREDHERLSREVDRLNEIVESLLGTRFQLPTVTGGPHLFGRPLGDGGSLSAGQRVLLALAYAFFLQHETEGLTILWDEPELFLHPGVVIDIVERVRRACPGSQVWLATHSVHLLAHYERFGIWYVQGGSVSRGRRESDEVLKSLLGDASRIDELHDFLDLPAQRAMRRFAIECLTLPQTVDTAPGDAQTDHIRRLLLGTNAEAEPPVVLDYGAGKGRLLGELIAATVDQGGTSTALSYFAYDRKPSNDDRRAVADYMAVAGLDPAKHYRYLDEDDVTVGRSPADVLATWQGRFDVVVLCNALHEIPPEEWGTLFGPDGVMPLMLKPTGALFIVEDFVLAAGERAHEYGFLLLDRDELRILFKSEDEWEIRTEEVEKYTGRLKVNIVPCGALARMDQAAMIDSLQALRDRAFKQARELHVVAEKPENPGRTFAVAAHQFLNAHLALAKLRPAVSEQKQAE